MLCLCQSGACPGAGKVDDPGCKCVPAYSVGQDYIAHTYGDTHSGALSDYVYSYNGKIMFDMVGNRHEGSFTNKQVIESVPFKDFVTDAQTLCCKLGYRKVVNVLFDGDETYNFNKDSGVDNLQSAMSQAQSNLSVEYNSHMMINAVRKTNSFHERIAIHYYRTHDAGKWASGAYFEYVPNDFFKRDTEDDNAFQKRVSDLNTRLKDKWEIQAFQSKYQETTLNDYRSLITEFKSRFPVGSKMMTEIKDMSNKEVKADSQ